MLWTHTETEPIAGSPLLVSGQSATRVIFGSHFGKLRCLDAADGTQLWSFKVGHWVTGTPALAASGGRRQVVFGAYDQRFYAVDLQIGQRLWTQTAASRSQVHAVSAGISRSPCA